MLGLLGMLMTGVVASGLIVRPPEAEEDDSPPAPEDAPPPDEAGAEAPEQLWDAGLEPAGVGSLTGTSDTALPTGGIQPGPDAPHLSGGRGDDGLEGTASRDHMFGRQGEDQLNGAGGGDRIRAGADDDTAFGGHGDDRIWGADGDDWLAGGMGHDLMIAGPGQDTLDGDAGNDTLTGAFDGDAGNAANFLNGGEGDDVLRVGAGDVATGGNGFDRFELAADMQGQIARIMDYDAAQDELVVVYDATQPAPVLSLAPGGVADEMVVLLDGKPVAEVAGAGGLTAGAIRLIAG